MAININGNNYGIAVDGNLTIEHVNFGFGGGVQSASGIHREELTDSLRNCIFDTRLFDSDDKLNALLGEIARSIDLGEFYQQLQELSAAAEHNDDNVVAQLAKMVPTFTPTRENLKL